MEEKERELSEEEYMEVVNGPGEEPAVDLLTDPSDVAASKETDRKGDRVGIGERLKAMREKKGFSTDELSKATGIGIGLIEKVEAGDALMPLGFLIKVGNVLSLSIRDVIGAGKADYTIVRKDDRTKSSRFGTEKTSSHGYAFESLAANKGDRKMEPFVVTLRDDSIPSDSTHGGQEFIFVLEGTVELKIDDTTEILAPGDSAYYESRILHRVRAHGGKTAKILAVLTD